MSSREQFEAWGCSDIDLSITLKCETYAGIAWLAWQAATSAMEVKCAALAAELKQSQIDASCYKKGMEASNERLVQLAAENVGLNEKMNKLATWPGIEFYSSAWEFNNGDGNAALEFMCDVQTPATDAFLAEVRASSVEEFLRGSQLPYQIATVLADYDNVDDATLQTVIWSGQPPEPDGDVWHLEYVSRGNAIVRAVLKELRKGVQS